MKLMFASDIHGSLFYAEKVAEAYKNENAEKLILLGDLLYHGPRNDLPKDYNPKGVIALLNSMKQEILAVRGNCCLLYTSRRIFYIKIVFTKKCKVILVS